MLKLSAKSLPVYLTFLLFLNGCGSSGSGGSSDVQVVPIGNGTALLSWFSPTQNTNGSPLNDLDGFKIRYGTSSGNYSETITIDNEGLSSFVVENLGAADWYFVMTAFNTGGFESSYSTEVNATTN